MTSGNDKSTNSQKKVKSTNYDQLSSRCQAQVDISVHSYEDTSFLFVFKNTRRSKHFVARFRLRQHKSPQAEKSLSTYAWEAGAEMIQILCQWIQSG